MWLVCWGDKRIRTYNVYKKRWKKERKKKENKIFWKKHEAKCGLSKFEHSSTQSKRGEVLGQCT